MLVLVAIGAFVFWKLPGIQDVPAADAAGGRVDVQVKGHRYYWNFTYPNGVIAVDKLRAPVGQNVRLEVTAPDFDVIHSWWIPALGGKFDAIPGKTNETWFNARPPGIYRGQCAELCGIQHAAMKAEVEAMPRAEFEAWLARRGLAGGGHVRARQGDVHRRLRQVPRARRRGRHRPGARRQHTAHRRRRVEQVVRNGRGAMPPIGTTGTTAQMDALTNYLEGGARWRLTSRPPIPAWQRGRVVSWLVTVDHKRIGILYIVTSGLFFLAGGIMALLIRTQLAQADNDFIDATPTTSSSPCTARRWSSSSSCRSSPASATTSSR